MKILHVFRRILAEVSKFFLKFEFEKLKGVIISPHELKGCRYISIDEGTIIASGAILTAWDSYADVAFCPKITIGKNCYLGENIHITACDDIYIGDNVLTGRYVYISDNFHGDTSFDCVKIPPLKRPIHIKGPVIIEDNVWIGERVAILSGVHVGESSIIAANAVVTKDVPPYSVVGGVPARVIKYIKKI